MPLCQATWPFFALRFALDVHKATDEASTIMPLLDGSFQALLDLVGRETLKYSTTP